MKKEKGLDLILKNCLEKRVLGNISTETVENQT